MIRVDRASEGEIDIRIGQAKRIANSID